MRAVRASCFRRRVASHPSREGSERSMTIASGCMTWAIWTALTPSPATRTRMPCAAKYDAYISRSARLSSAISTRPSRGVRAVGLLFDGSPDDRLRPYLRTRHPLCSRLREGGGSGVEVTSSGRAPAYAPTITERGGVAGRRSAPDEGRDRSGEVERIDGLRQKRLEAKGDHSFGVVTIPVRGDRDRRDAAALVRLQSAKLLDEPEPVLGGHRQVRDNRVQTDRLDNGQCVARGPRLEDVGSALLQRGAEEFKRVVVIVHDQDVNVVEIRTILNHCSYHQWMPPCGCFALEAGLLDEAESALV